MAKCPILPHNGESDEGKITHMIRLAMCLAVRYREMHLRYRQIALRRAITAALGTCLKMRAVIARLPRGISLIRTLELHLNHRGQTTVQVDIAQTLPLIAMSEFQHLCNKSVLHSV